ANIATFRSLVSTRSMVAAHFNGGIDPVDNIAEMSWRERLLTRLAADIAARQACTSFRLLGVDGTEYLRIDRSSLDGAVHI
ncbi:hypothetical protein, partial [Shewanella algae]|uniref:hypothetical protein n=1 Tax=Shewanella algae TaxID=38313 RepID=UPI00313E0526